MGNQHFNYILAFLVSMLLVVCAPFGVSAQPAAMTCRQVFSIDQLKVQTFAGPTGDLQKARSARIRHLTTREISKLNSKTVHDFEAYRPEFVPSRTRGSAVSYSQLQQLLKILKVHPVVGPEAREKYKRDCSEIGYCFGRATFLHLALLKMGLQKNSIRKVWTVGAQENPDGKDWGYHVATAAFVKGYGWLVVDTNTFKIQPIRLWFNHFDERSRDGKTMLFVTKAERFGVSLEKYDRVQMGLDLKREEDWFQHYFVDLTRAVAEMDIDATGLGRVVPAGEAAPAPPPKEPSIFSRLKSLIWVH